MDKRVDFNMSSNMLDDIHGKYVAVMDVAKQLAPLYGKSYEHNKVVEFSLGNAIFVAPNNFTGISSEKAALMKKPGQGSDTTWEHIFGRKNSAIAIINAILKKKSDRFILQLIRSRCRVAITTREENVLLRSYQQETHIYKHPRTAYLAAGIGWTKWIGSKVYNIDGKVYNSKNDILKDYNITSSQLNYRLGKQAKKWKGWKIERITQIPTKSS